MIRSLGMGNIHRPSKSSYATRRYPTQTWQTTWEDMGSPNLSYMYTTCLLNPIPLWPRPTSCNPPFLSPHSTTSFSLPLDDTPFKYVTVHLTNIECSSATRVTQNRISTVSFHPSPPSQLELENAPYAPLATPYPRQQHNTFASPPSFSTLTPTNTKQRNLFFLSTPQWHCTFTPELQPKSHMQAYV